MTAIEHKTLKEEASLELEEELLFRFCVRELGLMATTLSPVSP